MQLTLLISLNCPQRGSQKMWKFLQQVPPLEREINNVNTVIPKLTLISESMYFLPDINGINNIPLIIWDKYYGINNIPVNKIILKCSR